jgi:type I restriction enzyme S subunit
MALPPLAEQDRIVVEVERRLSALAQIEEEVNAALNLTSQLRVSLFHRALTGKLVEQQRRDQPATELLAHIRVVKEEWAKQPKVLATSPDRIKKENLPMLTPDDIKPNHLANLLRENKGPLDAKALWRESQLSIDDFYAQLKKELGKTLVETGRDRRLKLKS